MTRLFRTFREEEDGNTTIDWVVLTAGVLMLSAAVLAAIGGNATEVAGNISAVVSSIETDQPI